MLRANLYVFLQLFNVTNSVASRFCLHFCFVYQKLFWSHLCVGKDFSKKRGLTSHASSRDKRKLIYDNFVCIVWLDSKTIWKLWIHISIFNLKQDCELQPWPPMVWRCQKIMLMPQMHKKMMTATNLLSELAHALRRSIGDNGDQENSNQQNTNDPNTMEKTKEVSIISIIWVFKVQSKNSFHSGK